jgi:hypothetical protein
MAATKRKKRRPERRRPSRTRATRRAARRQRPARASARRRPAKKAARRAKKVGSKPKKVGLKSKKATRRKTAPKRQTRPAGKRHRPARPSARPAVRRDAPPSVLGRSRRQLPEEERTGPAAELVPDRMMQAARAGHDEMRIRLKHHTETSPELTAGDPDAKWEDAYAVGDEAPGGDNPTPDQDRVDDIGKALGIQYRDDQELQGGDEVKERDRRRWELDPASSEDWPHDKKGK